MKQWHRYIGTALAARGMLVVIPDYRQYPEVTFPGFMNDAAAAVAWAATNAARFGGDPRRLFLMGHSAGGQIVTLLALDPSLPAHRRHGARGHLRRDRAGRGLRLAARRSCGFPGHSGRAWAASRPVNHVTSHAPPMLLLTGEADGVVEPGNTARLASRLRAAGVPVTVTEYPGYRPHGLDGGTGWPVDVPRPGARRVDRVHPGWRALRSGERRANTLSCGTAALVTGGLMVYGGANGDRPSGDRRRPLAMPRLRRAIADPMQGNQSGTANGYLR